ncbi:hypothetical protein ABEB36_003680 [Hypothenemus hampei]|uniref:Transferrin n=1 Tax=Hypothenemus hampei TaxID=57062 RepID=A0ABD1F4I7_HYPHA
MRFFKFYREYFICLSIFVVYNVYAAKYKMCVVNGKENPNQSFKFCRRLNEQDSKVECLIALDRLDCLRRIHKGKADFGLFTPEDLIAATNSEIDLFIINEIRYKPSQNFEYEIVAVVSNKGNIRNKHEVRGKRYCHPGYGYEADWTRILSNYFEASILTPQCFQNVTITENRIRASSNFFKSACKSGPWVNNPILDRELKQKYSNLCELCGDPNKCSTHDKYWGRRGSLLCLTDGAGDISWARLEDVRQHFGFIPGGKEANPEDYSLLCPDDTIMPLNSSNPCIWVVKPWAVVGTGGTNAVNIQDIIVNLNHTDTSSWQSNLLNLIEPTFFSPEPLNPIIPIETYLRRAKGFLNANSFSACHPPRTIRICTTSNIETAKCSWLRESAAVYGIEPDLDCLKADNKTHCMMALNDYVADVVMVGPDMVEIAKSDFQLTTLFYETVSDLHKYITVAVTKENSKIDGIHDLKGRKACFPNYNGIAWNSVASTLQRHNIIGCEINVEMANFFGPSCVPNMPNNESKTLWNLCQKDFEDDMGALRCLLSDVGDVAFVSRNLISQFNNSHNMEHLNTAHFHTICLNQKQDCHLSWAPPGQAMVRSSSSDLWKKDTLDVFLNLDGLFGKNYKGVFNTFTMYGKYDGKDNILFNDVTEKLRDVPTVKNTDRMELFYEDLLNQKKICYSSSSHMLLSFRVPSFAYLILVILY